MLDVSDDSSPYRALIANHMLTSAATMYTGPAMIPPGRSRTGRKGIRSVQESSSIETRMKPRCLPRVLLQGSVPIPHGRCHRSPRFTCFCTEDRHESRIPDQRLLSCHRRRTHSLSSFASTEPRLTPACSLSVDWHCYAGGAERRPPYGQSCRLACCRFSEAKVSCDCISSR